MPISPIIMAIPLVGLTLTLAILVSAWKCATFHNGPDPFELIAMLWRGEIKRRSR